MSRSLPLNDRRARRCWRFGTALFDERNWALQVDGRRVAVEAKPLELLHELLLHAGEAVDKHTLMDAVWPDVSVVEASLPTAIAKLRRALGDKDGAIIETVPRIGYRLAIPVELVDRIAAPAWSSNQRWWRRRGPLIAGAASLTFGMGLMATAWSRPIDQREVEAALRKVDVERIEQLLKAGWDPNTPLNAQGDTALNLLLGVCEWNPGHDRARLLLAARTLLEGGASFDKRNAFGDTAYSIAAAPRYCGPNHPVTVMLRTLCHAGEHPPGDKCLARYHKPPTPSDH